MKRTFDSAIKAYEMLMEADEMPVDPNAQPDPTGGQPPVPVAPQPTSPAFAAITQTILDAFKTKPNLNRDAGVATTPITRQNVYHFLNIIQKNLPPDAQQHFNRNFGKGGKTPVEGNDLIDMVTIAMKALYDVDKSPEGSEYSDINNIDEVTVDNARTIYDKIVNAISLNSKDI